MSAAARTARSASSSCSCGMPNTAMTASPMNFSTVPPWRSIEARIVSKYLVMTLRSGSGSSPSPIAVDPVTSQNTIETVLRTSPAGSAGAVSGVAQFRQNFARSGFCSPQFGHSIYGTMTGPRQQYTPGAGVWHYAATATPLRARFPSCCTT